MKKNHKI